MSKKRPPQDDTPPQDGRRDSIPADEVHDMLCRAFEAGFRVSRPEANARLCAISALPFSYRGTPYGVTPSELMRRLNTQNFINLRDEACRDIINGQYDSQD